MFGNKLCCFLHPWVICKACEKFYCSKHWGDGGSKDIEHYFAYDDFEMKLILCKNTDRRVKWSPATPRGNPASNGLSRLIPYEDDD